MSSKRTLAAETILVVEDDKNLRFSLSLALKTEGYRVVVGEDGDAALEVAAARRCAAPMSCSPT